MWLVCTYGDEDGWEGACSLGAHLKSAVVEVPHGFALGGWERRRRSALVRGSVRGRSRRESGRESAGRGRLLRPAWRCTRVQRMVWEELEVEAGWCYLAAARLVCFTELN